MPPPGRTHPLFSRLMVSQDNYHVARYFTSDPAMWADVCRMMDDEIKRVLGYLSPDRRWLWQDRRHFYE